MSPWMHREGMWTRDNRIGSLHSLFTANWSPCSLPVVHHLILVIPLSIPPYSIVATTSTKCPNTRYLDSPRHRAKCALTFGFKALTTRRRRASCSSISSTVPSVQAPAAEAQPPRLNSAIPRHRRAPAPQHGSLFQGAQIGSVADGTFVAGSMTSAVSSHSPQTTYNTTINQINLFSLSVGGSSSVLSGEFPKGERIFGFYLP